MPITAEQARRFYDLGRFVVAPAWTIQAQRVVTAWAVPSQVLVARRT